MFEKLSRLHEKANEFRETMKREGTDAVNEALQEFFQRNPKVEALRWRQYTPYFNDGDACVFGVNDVYVKLIVSESETPLGEDDGDYGDGFLSSYEVRNELDGDKQQIAHDMAELDKSFSALEPALEMAFGDHAMVTATREGIEIEEYEHD